MSGSARGVRSNAHSYRNWGEGLGNDPSYPANELAQGLAKLGYDIEKSHADGRFEIAGVPRKVIEAFSTRRAEIEAAMAERGLGETSANPRLAERAALMTRAHKREIDKMTLKEHWLAQAGELQFDARALAGRAMAHGAARETRGTASGRAASAVEWAMAHLAEREAVFARTGLFAAALARQPGAVTKTDVEREVAALEKAGRLHCADLALPGGAFTTDKALAQERETIELMRDGQDRSPVVMGSWIASARLHKGPLTKGQKEAVKLILSSKDRVVGVQGYAGTGKTTMLRRANALAGKSGYRMIGLAGSVGLGG